MIAGTVARISLCVNEKNKSKNYRWKKGNFGTVGAFSRMELFRQYGMDHGYVMFSNIVF